VASSSINLTTPYIEDDEDEASADTGKSADVSAADVGVDEKEASTDDADAGVQASIATPPFATDCDAHAVESEARADAEVAMVARCGAMAAGEALPARTGAVLSKIAATAAGGVIAAKAAVAEAAAAGDDDGVVMSAKAAVISEMAVTLSAKKTPRSAAEAVGESAERDDASAGLVQQGTVRAWC